MTHSRDKSKKLLALTASFGFLLLGLLISPAASQDLWLMDQLPFAFGEWQYCQPARGESLAAVARRQGVALRMLRSANPNYRGGVLRIPSLRLPPPGAPDTVVINLPDRTAYLCDASGRPNQAYPVAIGRVGWETPTGDFKVRIKTKNPTWYPPQWADVDEPVPPGPHNPLGDRWMGLSIPGYGMHATNNPSSVGFAASHGCMRMYPEQARDLFDRIEKGTPVKIIYETFLLGYAPNPRRIYLAVYADIYNKGTTTRARVRGLLDYYGLGDLVEEEQLDRLIHEACGLPTPILGSELPLEINDIPVELAFPPTARGEDFLLPAASLAAALGAGVRALPESDWYFMQRGDRWLAFSPSNEQAWSDRGGIALPVRPAVLKQTGFFSGKAGDLPFVSLAGVCEALGAAWELDAPARRLRITDSATLSPPPNLSAPFSSLEAWRFQISSLPLLGNRLTANSAENPWEGWRSNHSAVPPAAPTPER